MAEQEKSQIQTTIMNLTADCERLEDEVDQLNQDAVDTVSYKHMTLTTNREV